MPLAMASASSKLALDQADDRAEDFFLGDAHVGLTSLKMVGAKNQPLCAPSVSLAAGEQLCAFFFGDGARSVGGLDLLLVDLRAHLVFSSRPSPTRSDWALD
jgi:hypothetical protein